MSRAVCVIAPLVLMSVGCGGGEPTPEQAFAQSCSGQVLRVCRAHEYAIVREASISPDNVAVDDPFARIQVHVAYDRCADAPGPHSISLRGLAEAVGSGDAGVPETIYPLVEIIDNGANGDAVAEDGVIDVDLPNFIVAPLPPGTALRIRFEPHYDICKGGVLELPYTSGPAWAP